METSHFSFKTGSDLTTPTALSLFNSAFVGYFVSWNMTVPTIELTNAVWNVVPHLCLYMYASCSCSDSNNSNDGTKTADGSDGGDGEFVGLARTAIRGRRAWVAGLAIVPEWRGKKVGKVLMERYLRMLRDESGVEVVQLECFNVNKPAMGLYLKMGFEVDFGMRDFVMEGIEKKQGKLMEGLVFKGGIRVDLGLPWLQYRIRYSWQREMTTVSALVDARQWIVWDEVKGKVVVGIVAERKEEAVRIMAVAYEGGVEADVLGAVIRHAAVAEGKGKAQISLEPESSELIKVLEKIARRDESFEEQHVVYGLNRG